MEMKTAILMLINLAAVFIGASKASEKDQNDENGSDSLVTALLNDSSNIPKSTDDVALVRQGANPQTRDGLCLFLSMEDDPKAQQYVAIYRAFLNHDTIAINLLLNDCRMAVDNHVLIAAIRSFHGQFQPLEMLINHEKFHLIARKRIFPIALILNKLDLVKWLISTLKINLHQQFDERRTFLSALHNGSLSTDIGTRENLAFTIAVREHDCAMVEMLIRQKIGTPQPVDFLFAVWQGNVPMVRLLLIDGRIDPNIGNGIAIRKAVTSMHIAMVMLLLDDKRVDPNVIGDEVFSLFYHSVNLSGNACVILESFIKHEKINPTIIRPWLVFAFRANKKSIVDMLIKFHKLDPYQDFIAAVRSRDRFLADKFLSPPIVDLGRNHNEALHMAICHSNEHMVRLLLSKEKVNLNDRDGIFLAIIVDLSDSMIAAPFLSHESCNPNAINNFALRLAIRKRDLKMIKKILCLSRMQRVDPNIPIYEDGTPLILAVKSGQKEIVDYLLAYPKFLPKEDDLDRALSLAQDIMETEIAASLETAFVSLGSDLDSWEFSVDPVSVLLWIKDAIKEMHSFYKGKGYYQAKPIDEMVNKIIEERFANVAPCRLILGFEPLKLAYEDFRMSRPEMSDIEKNEEFKRIMTADIAPESKIMNEVPSYLQPEENVRKRLRQEGINSNVEQEDYFSQTEEEVPIKKRRKNTSILPDDCQGQPFVPNPLFSGLLEVVDREWTGLNK
jgi:ankyrin repeat protein